MNKYKKIIENAGGIYIGIQSTKNHGNLILFNDSQTRSTLAIKENELTLDNIRNIIEKSRLDFNKKENENGKCI